MVLMYILLAVVANILVSLFGPVMIPINSFFLIGADMVIRDKLHERWKKNRLWLKMVLVISVAGLISSTMLPSSGTIALASFLSFSVSSLVNSIVYDSLHKKRWMIKSNGSNVLGIITDSFMFPTIAFGVVMPEIIISQIIMKSGGSLLWSWVLRK